MLRELTLRTKSVNCPCSTSIYPCILMIVAEGKKLKLNLFLPTNCLLF